MHRLIHPVTERGCAIEGYMKNYVRGCLLRAGDAHPEHTRCTPGAHPVSFGCACWRRRAAARQRRSRTGYGWPCSGRGPAACPRASRRRRPLTRPPRLGPDPPRRPRPGPGPSPPDISFSTDCPRHVTVYWRLRAQRTPPARRRPSRPTLHSGTTWSSFVARMFFRSGSLAHAGARPRLRPHRPQLVERAENKNESCNFSFPSSYTLVV
mmetsp:Transcript_42588/g.106091  ORF Transcript_42588/g.106091 Transcript_42588/m.106091 type:complete len:209 (+) Transcript_42588:862-1488(+)